jgi:hypothetical protein
MRYAAAPVLDFSVTNRYNNSNAGEKNEILQQGIRL